MKNFKKYLTEAHSDGWGIKLDSLGASKNIIGYPHDLDENGKDVYLDDVRYIKKNENQDFWDDIQKIHPQIEKLANEFDKKVIKLMEKYGYEHWGRK